ncbi:hypothetical protein HUE46_06305 [Flavobacterium columnare]|uniref:leucine-rich repeat domain-containing protein n=1 Tax=Flavobacterium columnare TaxID=996 RepID=UPI00177A864C|nr:leucine-rich repeat domain-containing protein [Flavobacterium columnare]QOG89655.1 hypothetical protein HUE41_06305 [Flavobacterium columnare]QOG92311.1 hypothetical protein HUE42_06300 [Flavobacterium columnare]QOG94976.1 hypothetical protein HUE43_06305 [Flavobacterium columnare]QOG97636.1 hypothetical protein HUE44_06300 [Flavobacterium columnare]QOH00295.1 hypothetical protein HUE45_06300 [Flavobacterium columnare]
MKLIQNIYLYLFILLNGFGVVAQNYNDAEIGFDPVRTTQLLQEHGITDPVEVNQEITLMRDMQKRIYEEQQKIQQEILHNIKERHTKEKKRKNSLAATDIPVEERNALIAFYKATNGDNWKNTLANDRPWKINDPTSDVSTWYGVGVSNGHVCSLSFFSFQNGLKGTLSDLSSLKYLEILSVNFLENNLSGNKSLPYWITKMNSLTSLSLRGCDFESIPDLSTLENLTSLNLSLNKLGKNQMSLPSWLQKMKKLEYLEISGCEYVKGFTDLSSLINLRELDLSNNNLDAEIPIWINKLSNLKKLNLTACNIGGTIPDLPISLEYLYLNLNRIDSLANNSLQKLVNLNRLFLTYNQLSGEIPNLSNLKVLRELFLGYNPRFDKQYFPNWIYDATNLIFLDLENTNLYGSIDEKIGTLTELKWFDISKNNFKGNLPSSISNLKNLTHLFVEYNEFSGYFPDLPSYRSLLELKFNSNYFRFIDMKNLFERFGVRRPFNFFYGSQKPTDSVRNINRIIGETVTLVMCEDGRYLPDEDTFQWYKNGSPILGATSREYTIPSVSLTDAGIYTCQSYNKTIKDLVLERNFIMLNVTNCKPLAARLYMDDGSECKSSCTYTCGDNLISSRLIVTDLLQSTIDQLNSGTYFWTIKDPNENIVYTTSDKNLNYTLTTVGINTIELKFTTTTGCVYDYKSTTEVRKCPCDIPEGKIVIASEITDYKCGNKVIENLRFEPDDKSIDLSKATYQWVFKDVKGQIISTVNTPNAGVTFSMPGSNSIELTVTLDGCSKVINPLEVKVVECCDLPFPGVILNFEPKTNDEFFSQGSFQSLWSITNKEHNPAVNSWVEYVDQYDNLKKFYTGGSENGCQYLEGKMIGRINEVEWCSSISKEQNPTKDLELNKSKEKTQTLLKKMNVNCVGKVSHFTFSASAKGVEYSWSMVDPSGVVVDKVIEMKGYYQYTPTKVGSYRLNLKITTAEGCISEFFYPFEAQDCFQSCITANGNSTVVKKLVLNLLNHLRQKTLNGESIPSGYICDELIDLKPYITYSLPRIYGFSMDDKSMKFWFRPLKFIDKEPDFIAADWNTTSKDLSFSDLDLLGYTSSDYLNLDGKLILSDGSKPGKVEIRHINFCPEQLLLEKCKNHVALVLDESGSLDERERAQLKRQLSAYFTQQAEINEKQGGNMYLSVIGMSNTDEGEVTVNTLPNTWRNDYIAPIKIDTNNLKSHFLPWLSNYCKKYNKKDNVTGLSEGSDFWRSGLETALFLAKESYLKLNMVIMITDGSQTTDLDKLQATMLKFNNKSLHKLSGGQEKKPHLFVIGVENGYYVYNKETTLPFLKRKDPNYTTSKPVVVQNDIQEETNSVNENISEVNLLEEDNSIESLNFSENRLKQSIAGTTQEGALTSSLALSLKYLFDLENARIPKNSSIFPSYFKPNENPNFQLDYFPLLDFKFLGEEVNDDFLSKGIVLADLGCPYEGGKTKCSECYSFQPEPSRIVESTKILDSKNYILGAWVREDTNTQVKEFTNVKIQVSFENADRKKIMTYAFKPKGEVVEGWQRINEKFNVPVGSEFMIIELVNDSKGTPVFFDDIRIHPTNGSMKSFVYDPENFKLMSELDENNYATFYEYDNEGGLIRVKKETLKGIKTIQETRSGNYIKVN